MHGVGRSWSHATPSPVTMPETVRVGSLALHHVPARAPGGAPVLFIHGIVAAGWIFERWLDAFAARGHPAWAVDLRGHGDSPVDGPLGRVRLTDFLDDAERAARDVAARDGLPVIVGHSMGGLFAQKLAERGLARALVLIGSAPPRGINLVTPRLLRVMSRYTRALLFSGEIVPRAADLEELSLNAVRPEERASIVSRVGPESGRASRELTLGALPVDARRVSCPVLVMSGDADRFIPLATARRIATRYRTTCVVLRDHGHMPMREPGEERVREAILDWIATLPAGR